MSKTTVKEKVRSALWAKAAGRCEYRGCNEGLVGDLLTGKEDGLYGFIAHIVADVPGGPRGDPVRSPQLASELSNLMLLCAKHHKLIDVEDVAGHPEPLLLEMKAAHESRIEINASICEDRGSHVIRFGANIGTNEALVSTKAIFAAMPPDRHPAVRDTIDLELTGLSMGDDDPDYWRIQRRNLRLLFQAKVKGRIERQELRHLSVFALAPQPLLIELGTLLYDIVDVTVHQKIRNPSSWRWQDDKPPLRFNIRRPDANRTGAIALKIAVSATVNDDRIEQVLGPDAAIWSIEVTEPGVDVVRRLEDTLNFKAVVEQLLNEIKARHGEGKVINLFPVMPASLAVQTGRAWMPKADLALRIYDQKRDAGFVPIFSIGVEDAG